MYEYIEVAEGIFHFFTKNDIEYYVVFARDESIFTDFNKDEIFAYEVMVDPVQTGPVPFDATTSPTVSQIIDEFFSKHDDNIILYTCRDTDGKEVKRQIAFTIWFERSNKENIYRSVPVETPKRLSTVIYKKGNSLEMQLLERVKYFVKNPEELDEIMDQKGEV